MVTFAQWTLTAFLYLAAVGCLVTAAQRSDQRRQGAALFGWLALVVLSAAVGATAVIAT